MNACTGEKNEHPMPFAHGRNSVTECWRPVSGFEAYTRCHWMAESARWTAKVNQGSRWATPSPMPTMGAS